MSWRVSAKPSIPSRPEPDRPQTCRSASCRPSTLSSAGTAKSPLPTFTAPAKTPSAPAAKQVFAPCASRTGFPNPPRFNSLSTPPKRRARSALSNLRSTPARAVGQRRPWQAAHAFARPDAVEGDLSFRLEDVQVDVTGEIGGDGATSARLKNREVAPVPTPAVSAHSSQYAPHTRRGHHSVPGLCRRKAHPCSRHIPGTSRDLSMGAGAIPEV